MLGTVLATVPLLSSIISIHHPMVNAIVLAPAALSDLGNFSSPILTKLSRLIVHDKRKCLISGLVTLTYFSRSQVSRKSRFFKSRNSGFLYIVVVRALKPFFFIYLTLFLSPNRRLYGV